MISSHEFFKGAWRVGLALGSILLFPIWCPILFLCWLGEAVEQQLDSLTEPKAEIGVYEKSENRLYISSHFTKPYSIWINGQRYNRL